MTDKTELKVIVPQLSTPSIAARGRPRLRRPMIPQELLEAMSELEREWYWYFVESLKNEYPDMTAFDLIQVELLLGPCFVACMRLEVQQMTNKELLMQSRQDPRNQFNNLMNSLSVRRRDRKVESQGENEDLKRYFKGLS